MPSADVQKNKKELFFQFIKFNIVGVLNTGLDIGIFTALEAVGFIPYIAHVISYSCGVLNSYIWNRKWSFKAQGKWSKREFIKFIAVNLVSLGVSTGVLALCIDVFHVGSDLVAKLIATPFSLIVNFIGNKLFVFKG
ncbi:MAG: GtrA family protein [Christensenellales bacterium]